MVLEAFFSHFTKPEKTFKVLTNPLYFNEKMKDAEWELLEKQVMGQSRAVRAVAEAVRRGYSGIRDPERPIACLLFSPPAINTGNLATADTVMRGICTVMLCILAFCRFTGKKPFFLLHGILCLYLAFRMINQYRFWSADPQILEYCFYLCGYVALMLAAYQQAAFDAGFGKLKALWLWTPVAVFLCFVTLAGPQELLFMPAFGLWALSGLSAVKPVPPAENPEEN